MTFDILSQQQTFTDHPVSALSILNQLPGYAMCMDQDNKFNYFINEQAVHMMGFKTQEDVYGRRIDEIHCRAAECADLFAEQNRLVFKNRQTYKIIDIHPYRNNEVKSLLTYKTPLLDHNHNMIAVMTHANDISQSALFNIAMALANADRKFRSKNNINQRSYNIIESFENFNLTNREIECLFYLVRGKTASQIASILFISCRTAEKHIANIKSKWGCTTKSDLIDKAVQNHFIDYLPRSILLNSNTNISVII